MRTLQERGAPLPQHAPGAVMPPGAYRKPPIIEAVIDIRFANLISANDLARLRKRLIDDYPAAESQLSLNFSVSKAELTMVPASAGFRMSSIDNLDIVLLQPEGITNSRLAPYNGWPAFRDRSQTVVSKCLKEIGSQSVKRLGVRYINRLDIPAEYVNVNDWLRLGVTLPQELSVDMTRYSLHVATTLQGNVQAIIQSSSAESPVRNYGSLALDIDVYIEQEIPQKIDDVWEVAEDLRGLKNRIFEYCITDRSRALFDTE